MKWNKVITGVAVGVHDYLMFTEEPNFDQYLKIVAVQGKMIRVVEDLVGYATEDYAVDPGGRKVNCNWRKLEKEEDVG